MNLEYIYIFFVSHFFFLFYVFSLPFRYFPAAGIFMEEVACILFRSNVDTFSSECR